MTYNVFGGMLNPAQPNPTTRLLCISVLYWNMYCMWLFM